MYFSALNTCTQYMYAGVLRGPPPLPTRRRHPRAPQTPSVAITSSHGFRLQFPRRSPS
jgi:hypothetical protein